MSVKTSPRRTARQTARKLETVARKAGITEWDFRPTFPSPAR